jgi:Na+-transporting methylmalonyl-CoA/oxaloacetate decarboxylase beta subunit
VLTAVLVASVLFFAGISQQFEPPVRYVLIPIGLMMFLAGGSLMILLPQNVGF